ncbi:alcohol dehydrogenase catalytic domain-containing protein [Variovorax sp. E3]|uniref:alcohol dehydrogenase catalytic domain-containing protein n=1 Tax=Variovorax sp. E3 TaxID=1914993 RepID=UPI0022B73959|nr:alcohol dehydrogenase catalytic domain-containing protein [Variovorax sp. E3]
MTNHTMRAVQLSETGGPEVLRLVDVPLPDPGPGQVRVRAAAIGAGGPDVLIRNGTYKWMPPLPAIPGNEMAGMVDAVGAGVTRLSEGDRVLVSARELAQRGGCYAECICVSESAPFVLPPGLGFEDAVSWATSSSLLRCLRAMATCGRRPSSCRVRRAASRPRWRRLRAHAGCA